MKTTTTTTRTARTAVTMRNVFAALVREMGSTEGTSIFNWYCRSYGVTAEDLAPESVAREVFGL